MIVELLDAKTFNGDINYYSFAFQKFRLETIKQIVGGEYPTKHWNWMVAMLAEIHWASFDLC